MAETARTKYRNGSVMSQNDLVKHLKDAFLAGYYRAHPLGKRQVWELTPEEQAASREIEAAAYEWAHARMSILMVNATL